MVETQKKIMKSAAHLEMETSHFFFTSLLQLLHKNESMYIVLQIFSWDFYKIIIFKDLEKCNANHSLVNEKKHSDSKGKNMQRYLMKN